MSKLPAGEKQTHKLSALFSSDRSDWETPDWLFAALHSEFNFGTDVCATWDNKKLPYFYSPQQDAFKRNWHGACFCNPPYTREIDRWLAKAKQSAIEGATVVVLIPARTDTNWWFDNVRFSEVRFLKGRLRFERGETSAPFPSALAIFRPGLPRSTTYWHYRQIDIEPGYEARLLS